MKTMNPLKLILSYVAFYTTALAKVSFIIGSNMAFFSLASISAPMIGVFGGLATLVSVAIMKSVMAYLLGGSLLFGVLNFLPHLAAANYFNSSKVFKLIIPILAMAIFIVHPQGSVFYSLLWLIPIACYFSREGVFAKSLGATFSAHALGSVIWLFTVPMTSFMWLGIIPIALLERSIFAFGIFTTYHAINFMRRIAMKHSFFAEYSSNLVG